MEFEITGVDCTLFLLIHHQFNRYVRKHIFWHVRLRRSQISLRIRAVWSEFSLSPWINFAPFAIQNGLRKTQINLRIHAVWSEYSLSPGINFAPLAIQNSPKKDSDLTARMRRLIWIFAERACPKGRFLTLRRISV